MSMLFRSKPLMLKSVQPTLSFTPFSKLQTSRPHLQRQLPAACTCMSNNKSEKVIHLLRHGETEMNVYLAEHPEDTFQDPMLFDTKLTERGQQQAAEAAEQAKSLDPPPELIISSPLTRALHTAEITFEEASIPRMAHSLARERTYYSSDVGVPKSKLQRQWPQWSFEGVEEENWWNTKGSADPKAIVKEIDEEFGERINRLRRYLGTRQEQSIVLVAHRDVVESFTGKTPGNCEFASIKL